MLTRYTVTFSYQLLQVRVRIVWLNNLSFLDGFARREGEKPPSGCLPREKMRGIATNCFKQSTRFCCINSKAALAYESSLTFVRATRSFLFAWVDVAPSAWPWASSAVFLRCKTSIFCAYSGIKLSTFYWNFSALSPSFILRHNWSSCHLYYIAIPLRPHIYHFALLGLGLGWPAAIWLNRQYRLSK